MFYRAEIDFAPDEVIVYLRKSRSDDPILTVEEVLQNHETRLDDWCIKNLGGKVPDRNKFKEVVSGETIADRPKFQEVLRLIESPQYKAVLVVEISRLSRGDLEDAGRLIKLFRYSNTFALTPERLYDIRDEFDREYFERELKRGNEYLEYTKRVLMNGKLLAVSQGNYIASRPPYGYEKITITDGHKKCRTLKEKKAEADIVRLIYDLYVNKNQGTQRICNHLEELGVKPPRGEHWSAGTLKDMLSNIHYIGKVRWNWRKTISIVSDSEIVKTRPRSRIGEYLIYDGKHEGIISEELFNAAQEKKGKNPRYPAKRKVRNPFASILFCECGTSMSLRPFPNARDRMVCNNRRHCKNGSCLYDDFANRICEILEQCIEDFEVRINNNEGDSLKLHMSLIKVLEQKLKDLQAKELSQWEAQSDPDPANRMPQAIFKQLNEKLLKEKEEIQSALCKAKESIPEPVDYEEKIKLFSEALAALKDETKSAEEKNRLLKACIERITYRREELVRLKDENGNYLKGKRGGVWNEPHIYIDVKLRV